MMTHCHNYLKFIYFSFHEFNTERESKITLAFSYYFHIGRPQQFPRKSSDSKVQRFQFIFLVIKSIPSHRSTQEYILISVTPR